VLDGDRMAYSLYKIQFLQHERKRSLCKQTLTPDDIEKLREAIRELYYFEFSIDDLRE
jgi:transmembrane 9 superfamily protein 1